MELPNAEKDMAYPLNEKGVKDPKMTTLRNRSRYAVSLADTRRVELLMRGRHPSAWKTSASKVYKSSTCPHSYTSVEG